MSDSPRNSRQSGEYDVDRPPAGDAVTREIASPGGCRSPERRLAAWARAVAVLSDAECRALLAALDGGAP